MLWGPIVVSLLLFRPALGLNGVSFSTECLDGIVTAVTHFTFAGADPDYYNTLCTYPLSVYSMWTAAKLYCKPEEIAVWSAEYQGYCERYRNIRLVPYIEVEPELTDAYIKSLPVVEFEDIDKTKLWNSSILISKSLHEIGQRTIRVFNEEKASHTRYGWAIYGFWGCLLLLGIVTRFVNSLFHSRLERKISDIERTIPSSLTQYPSSGFLALLYAAYHHIRTTIVIPAAFGSRSQQLLWDRSVQTRLKVIIVLAYWILNFFLCSASYEIFYPNLYFTRTIQIWRYVSDRTGIICYANLPMLWMFSGRNNVFIWATGWSFSTFNTFHLNIALVATLQAVVHSVGWSVIKGDSGIYAASWSLNYWYMGVLATISMALLLIFSSVLVRQRCYEVFLILHIMFSILTIVGLFCHTAIFLGSYNGYLWPLVVPWLFDRSIRIVRLVYCNLHVKLSGSVQRTSSTAIYDEEADVIRLEVMTPSKTPQPKPSQYYFLYQPLRWKGWENHPFTLANWVPAGNSNMDDDRRPLLSSAKLGTDAEVVTSSPHGLSSNRGSRSWSSNPELLYDHSGTYKLVFYIRPFDGWTKHLRDRCMRHPDKAINANIMIEGPYGKTEPLHHYENVIFITGGTGVACAIPYLRDHIVKSASSSTRTRNINLIFAAKQAAMIRSIAISELKPILDRSDVHATFYATSGQESAAAIPRRDDEPSLGSSSDDIEICPGRPNIKAAILDFVDEVNASSVGGRVAVLVCGPAAMADESRVAVHQVLKNGKQGVAYFEETFEW